MTLPDGFHWLKSNQNAPGGADVLAYRFIWLAQLVQRADTGEWEARLDVHLEVDGRQRRRPCTGFRQGRAGLEIWLQRHCERLTREAQQAKRLNEATTIRFLEASMHKPRAKDPCKEWVMAAVRRW